MTIEYALCTNRVNMVPSEHEGCCGKEELWDFDLVELWLFVATRPKLPGLQALVFAHDGRYLECLGHVKGNSTRMVWGHWELSEAWPLVAMTS
jgi:hypothetical protein